MKYKVNVTKEYNIDIIISAEDEEQVRELIEHMLAHNEIDFDEKKYTYTHKIIS